MLWRLSALEKDLAEERRNRHSDFDKLDKEKASDKDLTILADEVRGLRRALIIFSLSMIGTGGTFLLGVLALLQNGK